MSHNAVLASLDRLPDMPKLEMFALHCERAVAASATAAAMTSLRQLALFLSNVDEVLDSAAALPALEELVLDRRKANDELIGEFMAERGKVGLSEPTVTHHPGDSWLHWMILRKFGVMNPR